MREEGWAERVGREKIGSASERSFGVLSAGKVLRTDGEMFSKR